MCEEEIALASLHSRNASLGGDDPLVHADVLEHVHPPHASSAWLSSPSAMMPSWIHTLQTIKPQIFKTSFFPGTLSKTVSLLDAFVRGGCGRPPNSNLVDMQVRPKVEVI